MNAFNPLDAMKRLEAAGLERQHAEAIAGEIREGTSDYITKDQLDASLDKQTIKLGGFVAAMIVIGTTILGLLISIK